MDHVNRNSDKIAPRVCLTVAHAVVRFSLTNVGMGWQTDIFRLA